MSRDEVTLCRTSRSGRQETRREAKQKQYFWEHEKALPSKTFIVPCRAANAKADFPLDDLQSGRMDLACRAVSAAMFFSSGVRRDVDVVLLLGEEEVLTEKDTAGAVARTKWMDGRKGDTKKGNTKKRSVKTRAVWISGKNVRHLRPDEKNIACVLQTAVWAYSGREKALLNRLGHSRRQGRWSNAKCNATSNAEGAEAISCAERIAAEAISSPDILISCQHIPSAPQGASCGDMRSAPRHKPHDKSRESVQTWSEVETCFGIVDDGDGGDALMTEIEEMPDDGDGGDALDDEHQKGEKAPEDHEEGQPEDDNEGQHQMGEEAPEDHEDDEDDKEGQAAGHDQHQKGQEAPEDDEDDKEGQAAGRAGSSGSWGGVSGQGRLEIPSRVREVVGAAYLRCLNGWRVSNLPTPGLQHVLDTVFKCASHSASHSVKCQTFPEADARERGVCGEAGGLRGGSEGGRGGGVEEARGGASEEPHVETDVHVGEHAACMHRGEGGRGAVQAACMLRGASEEPHVETDVHVESVLLQLDEEGDFVSDVLERYPPGRTRYVCVLGDHRGLCPQDERILASYLPVKVSVGPRPMLTSQCITLILHYIDMALLGKFLKET